MSNLGISISSFAYPLVVLEATGSPIRAGIVGSVAGTAFVLRLPAGVLVDRWNRRAILLVCDGGRAVNAAALALVLALGHFFFAQVVVVAFFEAALGALLAAARPLPFVADAVSYLVSLVCVASVRTPLGGGGEERPDASFSGGLAAGTRWIWARPFLRALLVWMLGIRRSSLPTARCSVHSRSRPWRARGCAPSRAR